MFARIEVATRPEYLDAAAQGILRRVELTHPEIKSRVRWARLLDVYWLDMPVAREEVIPLISKVCLDKVLQWAFTGNLMPSAAGKSGSLEDLMQLAPFRPGKFWGIERRFRPGVTDNVGRTLLEAFEIALGRPLPNARASTGALLLLEGVDLNEDSIAVIGRDVFCNEMTETWTLLMEEGLKKNDRFHQERIKFDIPKVHIRGSDQIEQVQLSHLSETELEELSRKRLWALTKEEMVAIREYFYKPAQKEKRSNLGLTEPTDVELEVLAQTWSEHCKHKIFNSRIYYKEDRLSEIPEVIEGLFRNTIEGTTSETSKPWLLSAFKDNAGICAFDEEDAFCIKVETHNSPSALDPYGGALTGIVGVNRDILGCGFGAKPIFNTNVFCVAPLDYSEDLPEGLLHPRRILDGVRRGVEHGGNKSGIPTVNGALVFDDRYLGKPLVYCGTAGFMPRKIGEDFCQTKTVKPGDRVCMIGGRIGKDGIHGATFSSLALESSSPSSAVQLGDPITQKRMSDFLLEARDQGLYRAITDNGAGGLSSSVGEMAELSGGASIDVSLAKCKYPGLRPYELVVSESQERMTVAVAPAKLKAFLALAERRGVEVSDLGEFNKSGRFDILYQGKIVASLDLEFLHHGVPKLELRAEWTAVDYLRVSLPPATEQRSFVKEGGQTLLGLLSRPNIASKEWLIRQYDHEVQGTSVIKPLHTALVGTATPMSGPNDAGVIKPKPSSDLGLAVGCGINPKLSDIDPHLMAQSAVDEAVRNVLCVGAEFGSPEAVFALVDNFCWPDPVGDPLKTAWLVRACYGLKKAAVALSLPLVSGKDSMKNDFRGTRDGQLVSISVPPTLLMTAVARVQDIKAARTAEFKAAGDFIYLLGGTDLGLVGSEFQSMLGAVSLDAQTLIGLGSVHLGVPNWPMARRTYEWIGGGKGKQVSRLKSLHDVSEGGLLVAIAECLIARGLGAKIKLSQGSNPWERAFGEGFHSFVASVAPEDSDTIEAEWRQLQIPFERLGVVTREDRLKVESELEEMISLEISQLRSAWLKEGYWE